MRIVKILMTRDYRELQAENARLRAERDKAVADVQHTDLVLRHLTQQYDEAVRQRDAAVRQRDAAVAEAVAKTAWAVEMYFGLKFNPIEQPEEAKAAVAEGKAIADAIRRGE